MVKGNCGADAERDGWRNLCDRRAPQFPLVAVRVLVGSAAQSATLTPKAAMHIATQLAVFLENRPGTLARVCDALAEAGLNIYALSTSDTVDHTVVRMVVSDPRRALFLLEERGALVVENDVLMVEADNHPGSLAALAHHLAACRVNIEYAYCAADPKAKRGCMILRVSNASKALKALEGKPASSRPRRRSSPPR